MTEVDHDELASFTTLDYVVFSSMLVVSLGIGIFFSRRGNKNAEDYLLGGRVMSPYPVSLSLLSSFISAISLLGIPGEAYAHGLQQSFMIIGTIFGLLFAVFICVPIFYNLQITSINEYVERRFKCKYLHKAMFVLAVVNQIIYTGICLYAPTLALSAVTPLDYRTYIVILGIICTIYSSIGGLKAVVWTDVFQMSIMFIGLILILVLGTQEAGGFSNVWEIASAGGRTNVFNLDMSPHVRHNMINVIIQGATMWGAVYGTSQTNLQRICSVRSEFDAKLVIYLNLIGMVVMWILMFYSGIIAYSVYSTCDPMALGIIDIQDKILPYLVMDKIGYYGIPGLFVAAMFSGALSSLSSVINALVAMFWVDILQKFRFFKESSEMTTMLINKGLSCVIGAIMIGMAFLASTLGSVLQAGMTIAGGLNGPCFGVFILGIAFPKVGKKGAWMGLIISAVFMTWLSMGSFIFAPATPLLTQSIDNCTIAPVNASTMADDHTQNMTQSMSDEDEYESPFMNFYKISYTLFMLMGTVICLIVAFITTCITGGNDPDSVPQELLMVCLRKKVPKNEFILLPGCNCTCKCNNNLTNHIRDGSIINSLENDPLCHSQI